MINLIREGLKKDIHFDKIFHEVASKFLYHLNLYVLTSQLTTVSETNFLAKFKEIINFLQSNGLTHWHSTCYGA